jgi:hypothetical protein
MLEVWTNKNAYSRDIVHVHISPFVNGNDHLNDQDYLIKASYMDKNITSLLNENLIRLELEIEPRLFSEYIKDSFLAELRSYLHEQSELNLYKPEVVLLNAKMLNSELTGASSVILEIFITDQVNMDKEGFLNKKNVIELSILNKLAQNKLHSDEKNIYQRLVNVDYMVSFMRRKLMRPSKFVERLISLNTLLISATGNGNGSASKSSNNAHALTADHNRIVIKNVAKQVCSDYSMLYGVNQTQSCSAHGSCSKYTHKCVCKKNWMPNIYKYYIDYEADLTGGNNCGRLNLILTTIYQTFNITFIISIGSYLFIYLFIFCFILN